MSGTYHRRLVFVVDLTLGVLGGGRQIGNDWGICARSVIGTRKYAATQCAAANLRMNRQEVGLAGVGLVLRLP